MTDKRVNISLKNIKDVVPLDPKCLLLYNEPTYLVQPFRGSKPYLRSYKRQIHEYSWLTRWTNEYNIRLASIWKKSHPEGDSFVLEINKELSEEEAKTCIDKLKKLSLTLPEDPEVRYMLASFLHYESVFPDLAIEEYRKVLEANPRNLRARYRLALLLKDLLRLEEALEEFNEILKIDPDFEGARYYSQVISDIISHRGQDLIIAAMKGSRDVSIYFDLIYMMRALHLYYLADQFYGRWLHLLLWSDRALKLIGQNRDVLDIKDPEARKEWLKAVTEVLDVLELRGKYTDIPDTYEEQMKVAKELLNTMRSNIEAINNTEESELVKKLRNHIKSPKIAGLKRDRMIVYILGEMSLEQLDAYGAYDYWSHLDDIDEVSKKIGFIFMNSVHQYHAQKIFQEILKKKEDDEFAKKALKLLKREEVASEDKDYRELFKEIDKCKEKIEAGLADAETYCELGEGYLKLGEIGWAINAFDYALKLKPDLPRALFGLARAKFRGGYSGGEEIVLKLLEVDPQNVKKYLEAIASRGKYPGDEVLLKALEIDPEHASDYVKMFSFEGKFAGSDEVLVKALGVDEASDPIEYIKRCAKSGHYPGDDVLLKAIELAPSQEINFIKLFNFDGKFPGGRKVLEHALARGYKDAELFYLYAKTFDAVNSEVGEIYEKASGDYVLTFGLPHSFNILKLRREKVYRRYSDGYCLIVPHSLEDIEARVEYLKKAVDYDPNFFDAWVTLAKDLFDLMWYKGLDNQDEVIRAWREVLRLNPEFAVAHRYLAEVYWYTLRFDDALREFEEMERLRPDDTFNTLLYGNFLQYLGKFEEAEKKYEKLKCIASYYLGYLYHYLGRYDEAEIKYWEALGCMYFEWLDYTDIELFLALLMFQLERYDDILILFSTQLMSKGRWDLRPEYAFFMSKLMEKVKCYEVAELMLYEVEKKAPNYLKWSDSLANFKIKPYDFMKLHPRILSVSGRIEFRRSKPAFQEKLNFVEILDEALKYLERIKRNSDDVLAHYGLALLCEKVGNFEGAERELKEVLKIRPDFTQAQEKLEYLEKRRSGGN
jgi:tetratricopeptide (TPR) repeat protein